MLTGFAKILETFGMDDDAMKNSGVAVAEVNHIPSGSVNDETLEIVLEDADGNRRTFHLMELDAEY